MVENQLVNILLRHVTTQDTSQLCLYLWNQICNFEIIRTFLIITFNFLEKSFLFKFPDSY